MSSSAQGFVPVERGIEMGGGYRSVASVVALLLPQRFWAPGWLWGV